MKTKVVFQGQNLTADYVNVLRACLLHDIVGYSKLVFRPVILDNDPFVAARGRLFHILEALDGQPYVPVFEESETLSIFINGSLLDKEDAILLGRAVKVQFENGIEDDVLSITGFSLKHFRNLIDVLGAPIVDLLPKASDEDDPIPY